MNLGINETPVEETNLPRYVLFRGKRVRLISYSPKTVNRPAYFVVIDIDDQKRNVFPSQITFIKPRRTNV